MKNEKKHEKEKKDITNYDSSREEMYPLPNEEIVSYCEGSPCPFHHPERALEREE